MNKLKLQEKSKVEIKNNKELNINDAGKVLEIIFNSIPKSRLDIDANVKITHQFRGKVEKVTEVYDGNNEDENGMRKLEVPHGKIVSPYLRIDFNYKSVFPDSVGWNGSKYYEEKKVYIHIESSGKYCNWDSEYKIDADLKLEMDACQVQRWQIKFHDGITTRTQMAWGSATEKTTHHRSIQVKNSQLLSALVDEVLPKMVKTMKEQKEIIDNNDINRAERLLDKHYKPTKYKMTKDQADDIGSKAAVGLGLGNILSPKCKAELKEVKTRYEGIVNDIDKMVEKMSFEETIDAGKKYMKEYCKEIKD